MKCVRRSVLMGFGFLLAWAVPVLAQTHFDFSPAAHLDTGQSSFQVVIKDFNGDGNLDIVTATGAGSDGSGTNRLKLIVFLGNGDGSFQPRREIDYSGLTGASASGLHPAMADFNGDGFLDLAVGHGGTTSLPGGFGNKVTIHLGDGSGNFMPFSVFSTGGSGIPLVAADFNEDGRVDLLAQTGDDHTVRLHLGNGDGTFASGGTVIFNTSFGGAQGMVGADMNRDGHADAVITSHLANVFVALGNGAGSFNVVTTPLPRFNRAIAVGDLNFDGKLDVVAAGTDDVFVLLGRGDGTFQPPLNFPIPNTELYQLAIADFDLDGKNDVALAHYRLFGGADTRISILAGDGRGNLAPPQFFDIRLTPVTLAAADFNYDGLPDLVSGTESAGALAVLINRTSQSAARGALFEFAQTGQLQRVITNGNLSNSPARVSVIPARGVLQKYQAGNLLVSQFMPPEKQVSNNVSQIIELSPEGDFLRLHAGVDTGIILAGANDLHFKQDGTLLVTTGSGLDRVWRFSDNSRSLSTFAFICCPNGIAEDPGGNVYVTTTGGAGAAIRKFNAGGGFLGQFGVVSSGDLGVTLGGYGGLELGPNNTLFISQHPPTARVREFATDGQALRLLGTGVLGFPFELAVAPSGESFGCDDRGTPDLSDDAVVHLDADGLFVKNISHPRMARPTGITLTERGTLLVAGLLLPGPPLSTPINRPPVLGAIGDRSVREGELLEFTLSASDPDGHPLSFSASGLPPGAMLDTGTGLFRYTPDYDVSTAQVDSFFDVLFEVSDGFGGAAGETIRITVHDVAGGTPLGASTVEPAGSTAQTPVTVSFNNVTQSGITTLATSGVGPPPPAGFRLGAPPTYYDISTTAVFDPPVVVCIGYGAISFGNVNQLRLFHREGDVWVDRTILLDTANMTICAQVDTLSPFAIFQANLPPTADAGADQRVECTSPAGAAVTLTGAGSDPDGDVLSFAWRDAGGNLLGSAASLNLTLRQGTHVLTLTVDDGHRGTASDTVTVVVEDTTPPTLTLSTAQVTQVLPTASATHAAVSLSGIATASDACDAEVTITNDAPALFPIGKTVVTFTARDDSGNTTRKQLTVQVVYVIDGFFAPIRNDGSSIFKSGRTIPIKFRLKAADGSVVGNATATLQVFKFTDEVLGTTEEVTPDAAGSSNTDNLFRYDAAAGQYIYDLKTTGYTAGTYLLRATLNDGTVHDVQVSIR